jgi:hypothetical protein
MVCYALHKHSVYMYVYYLEKEFFIYVYTSSVFFSHLFYREKEHFFFQKKKEQSSTDV